MDTPSSRKKPALRFDKIVKEFFGVRVLKEVSFEIGVGQTMGLVGENGAGKSTLMNILGGNLKAESGELQLWGHPYRPAIPADAEEAGIAFVHQELNLFGNLSIAENLFLNCFPTTAGFINRARTRRETSAALKEVGLELSPDLPIDRLSAGERQLVEIAKALTRDARLIILDEPTTSLTDLEVERLFKVLRNLQKQGITLIYISHVMDEVMRLSDAILILRDGEVVGNGPKSSFTQSRMISLMVGRELEQLYPERTHRPTKERALEARKLCRCGVIKNIDLTLHRGEVLGVSGLMGSGRTELARILFGLDPFDSGDILLNEKPIGKFSPSARIQQGMAFLTEDRREEGLCLNASVDDNMTLVAAPRFTRGPLSLVDGESISVEVANHRKAVKLTGEARGTQPVNTLSGGNQQKVVLTKWLLTKPKVILLDEPTRGIDVGAKYEIYSLINELTSEGAAVLVISSELEELIGICDRIVTMRQGETTGCFQKPEFNRERILAAALH